MSEARLTAFLARVTYDLAAAQSAPLVVIGDRLGFYRTLAATGPVTASVLAARTGTDERYVQAWLVNQAAAGYVEHDPATGTFSLPDAHARVLASDEGPFSALASFQLVTGLTHACREIAACFRTGRGVPATAYDADVRDAMDRAADRWARGALLHEWLPALHGVVAKLESGVEVADVGCGLGAVVLALAGAFPRSRFTGFDIDETAIGEARRRTDDERPRVRFEVASATAFAGGPYDVITCFDCLHELADPAAAARHIRGALTPGGTWLIVEPSGGETPEDNLGPLGRLVSAVSALYCVPVSLAAGGDGSGAVLPEARLRDIVTGSGFAEFRRVATGPLTRVFEASA